jgi:hypothetical protein
MVFWAHRKLFFGDGNDSPVLLLLLLWAGIHSWPHARRLISGQEREVERMLRVLCISLPNGFLLHGLQSPFSNEETVSSRKECAELIIGVDDVPSMRALKQQIPSSSRISFLPDPCCVWNSGK